ncbi:MAG: TIGR00266 family protein [candidate division WOR-3 bacterium]|nr:MAG: TIGR00266 family protein [candidate division WOR-3 bacterium]
MEHETMYRPAYSLLKINLSRGETVQAEAGAMVSMSGGIEIETKMKGGLFGALKRSMLGGESFFLNTFRAQQQAEILFAPSLPGDIAIIEMQSQTFYAQSGAYIASSPELEIDTKWGGAKTFFSREGLFLLKIVGSGTLFLSSYGAIHEIELRDGETYRVDTGHMVAFAQGVDYRVTKVGGLKSTLFSGEGLVCELTGPGRIFIQSRSADAFLLWLIPQLPKRQ